MPSITSYKTLKVLNIDPIGAGGLAINDNFYVIADHIEDTDAPHGATSENTADTIVTRDDDGGFSAGTVEVSRSDIYSHSGFSAGVKSERTGATQTTNATPTTVVTLATVNNTVYWLRTMAVCRRTDSGTENAVFEKKWIVQNVSNTVSVTQVGADAIYLNTLTTANVTATVNGVNVNIKATGEAFKTIAWSLTVEWQGSSTSG